MRIALDPLSGPQGETGDLAGLTSGVDTFSGWVQAAKADFRKQAG